MIIGNIDIVYLFANGLSHWRNQELKYSLRSLEKSSMNYREVYIIGDKPPYLNNRIKHIHHGDNQLFCKEKRICEKIMKACNVAEISNPFAFFNDDFFLTKPIDFSQIPFYFKGFLQNSISKRNSNDIYTHSLRNTYDALTEKGFDTKHFDLHYPMYYDKKKFPEAMAMYDWNIKHGYVVKSLYANTLGIKGKYRADCKIMKSHDKEEILERIKDFDLFSTSEISRAIINILNEFYPNKSSYEL
jgi:hypothetical protein